MTKPKPAPVPAPPPNLGIPETRTDNGSKKQRWLLFGRSV
jgi:hypothetical protein